MIFPDFKDTKVIVAAVVLIGLLAAIGIQTVRIGWLQDDVKTLNTTVAGLEVSLDNAKTANDRAAAAIEELKDANQKFADLIRARDNAVAEAEAAVAAARVRIAEERALGAKRLAQALAEPGCVSVAAVRIDTACPAVIERLRNLDQNLHRPEDR